jgi:hypothetical protein
MEPKHTPWYRTKWGTAIAVVGLPVWYVWKRMQRVRILRSAMGALIALLIFIGLIYAIGHLFRGKPTTSSNTGNTSATATIPPSTPTLTGYGATLSEWNSTHTEDPGYTANTAYDPTSGLGNGYSDKYAAVFWTNGRALSYQIGFPSNTSITTAESEVMQEFPSDATILWGQENTSDSVDICYQIEVHSTILGEVLGNDGDSFVEFQTISGDDTSTSVGYYPSNVNDASLRNVDYKAASTVGGC